MRVLLLPSAYAPAVGGVEELTGKLARRLQAAGDAVEVWTHRHPASLPEAEVIDGVPVQRFDMQLPSAHPRRAADAVRRGSRTFVAQVRALRRFRPDVIHVQCFSNNGVYATALAAATRTPLVVTLQGETVMDDNDIYEHSASLRTGLRIGLRRADAVTGCSQFVVDDAVDRFGLAAGSGTVIFNGVDFDERAQSPMEPPFGAFVFAVGRMVEKKGFDLLLEAYAQIAERVEHGLLIGGDGAARPKLEARIRELGLEDRVWMPGRLDRGQVGWAMANASAFVLPSRVEPFGIVVLEALRGGAPVVATSHGGAGEIVRDHVEGLVVDPYDADALSNALLALLTDAELRDRFRQNGSARVEAFSWDHVAAAYRTLYDRLVTT